jgi:MoaA/NifB/PqqE/SkfB family radical SAM enzyme
MSRFCVAPWVSISTDVNGSIRPCCRYEQSDRQNVYKMPWMKNGTINQLYNSDEMRSLRTAFLNGEEPQECNWCWKEEEAGIKSFRQSYNELNLSYDLENPIPQLLDLKLSNVCNLKCRMCGPQASSSIAKEQKIFDPYHLTNKILGTKNEEEFFESIIPNVSYLELTGGEPFFSLENKKLIEIVSETKYAQNITLKITTNGMFYIPELMNKMKYFKSVHIALSIDDIGKRLEYQRKGSNWNTIKENIISMKKDYNMFDIAVYRTINNFNVYYLNELDDWAEKNNIKVISGFLHEPKHLNIQYIPLFAKQEIEDKLGENYHTVLSFMNSADNHLLIEFQNETKILDIKRKESFKEVFKEWADILLW